MLQQENFQWMLNDFGLPLQMTIAFFVGFSAIETYGRNFVDFTHLTLIQIPE